MELLKQFIEENENLFESLDYELDDSKIVIRIENSKKIELDDKDINTLMRNELIKNKHQLIYYKNYGISIGTYGEFFLGTDSDYPYEIYGNLEFDLKFRIGEIFVEFNNVSSLCTILTQPYFGSKAEYIADRGLREYFNTIKIYNAPQKEHRNVMIKALFYINGYYLKSKKIQLTIYNVISDESNDEIPEFEFESKEVIQRDRIRNRKDFENIEPLIFHNDASMQKDENKFLSYYRILEFFFHRGLERQVQKMRVNTNTTEKEIIKLIQNKDERSLLTNLLNGILTESDKKKLINYLKTKGLINKNDFNHFCSILYEYRNSIVHAKETQLENVQLPDIFQENISHFAWNYVVKYISEAAINRINLIE